MKVEVIEFYQDLNDKKKKILRGSAHVYLEELDIDLRGVDVVFDNGKPWITLPTIINYDLDQKKDVMFPVIQFSNREKTMDMRRSVAKAVKKFVLDNILKKKAEKVKKIVKVKQIKQEPKKLSRFVPHDERKAQVEHIRSLNQNNKNKKISGNKNKV